jgi:xylulokinase
MLALALNEYHLRTPGVNWVELPGPTYWQACVQGIREVLAKSGVKASDVAAVGITTQGETFIPMDAHGRELRDAIVWLDGRAVEEAEELKRGCDLDAYFRRTGLPDINPVWAAAKLMWLRKHEPEVFHRAAKFPLLEDYFIFKLTGTYATEASVSMSSGFLDIIAYDWWDEMLARAGVERGRLSRLHHSAEAVGRVSPQAAEETGLSQRTVVVTGALDQTAGATGAGNIAPGIITETTGTALAVIATTNDPVFDPKRRVLAAPSAARDRFILLPFAQTAGMTFKWFRDVFGEPEKATPNADAYDLLTKLAARVPPGCEGLLMLPHLTGSSCPTFNASARGAFVGISLSHGRGHFVRAVLESVAFMLREIVELLLELGVPVERVRSMGGGAKSDLWLQMKADVLQKPVEVPECTETASLGAAILAGVGAGLFKDLEDGVAHASKVAKRFEPNPKTASAYEEAYRGYLRLYNTLYG